MEEKLTYRLERARRKTVSLKIEQDGTLVVRAPLRYPTSQIDALLHRHRAWIEAHRHMTQQRQAREATFAGSEEQIETLRRAAHEILPRKVAYYAAIMGVNPTGVKITSAAKRFGSCSGTNSLCFSWRVMMYPEAAIDYVVVHELAHIRHHDHSPAFYAFVGSVLPDYRRREAILKEK